MSGVCLGLRGNSVEHLTRFEITSISHTANSEIAEQDPPSSCQVSFKEFHGKSN